MNPILLLCLAAAVTVNADWGATNQCYCLYLNKYLPATVNLPCPQGCVLEETVYVNSVSDENDIPIQGSNPVVERNPQQVQEALNQWTMLRQCIETKQVNDPIGLQWFTTHNARLEQLRSSQLVDEWINTAADTLKATNLRVDFNAPTCFTSRPVTGGCGGTLSPCIRYIWDDTCCAGHYCLSGLLGICT